MNIMELFPMSSQQSWCKYGKNSNNDRGHINKGHILRKPAHAVCKSQRCRPDCTSVQSGQHLCYSHFLKSIIAILDPYKISRF